MPNMLVEPVMKLRGDRCPLNSGHDKHKVRWLVV
jgi:hypothetical protein